MKHIKQKQVLVSNENLDRCLKVMNGYCQTGRWKLKCKIDLCLNKYSFLLERKINSFLFNKFYFIIKKDEKFEDNFFFVSQKGYKYEFEISSKRTIGYDTKIVIFSKTTLFRKKYKQYNWSLVKDFIEILR